MFEKSKPILAILSLLVIFFSTASGAAKETNELKHPFKGIPLEQSHVTDASGKRYFRLKKAKTAPSTFRNIQAVEDNEEPEFFYENSYQWIQDLVFGKSEETLELERVFEKTKKLKQGKERKNLQAAGDQYDLINYFEISTIYLMEVYIGSEFAPMEVVYDTGSSWMIVQSVNCETCSEQLFDEEESTSFVLDYPYFSKSYGSAYTLGQYSHDDFYLDTDGNFGVADFPFFLIDYQTGISPLGGIIGFSRGYPFASGEPNGPLFYYFLQNEGAITDLIFANYIAEGDESSFVTIGGYDEVGDYYEGDLVWLDVIENYFWATTTKGMIVNDKTYENKDTTYIILDTGTTLNYMSEATGKKIQKKIAKGMTGFKWFGEWRMKCDPTKFEPVFVEIGGVWFEIPPETYIFDLKDLSGDNYCYLGFALTSGPDWLFGGVFFRNYYSVWDEANSQVGFAVRTGSAVTTAPYAS